MVELADFARPVVPDFADFGKPVVLPTPRPLTEAEQSDPYPLTALPVLIRDAVREVASYVQAPVALIAASALAAVSTAVQTRFGVRRNANLVGPSTLYLLTVAASGERKTSVDNLFTGPINARAAHPIAAEVRERLISSVALRSPPVTSISQFVSLLFLRR
ncbi:DUF3987 domain-containing protein [Sphingomonas sp. DT-207]|uniref:DUF3987 domain-containing protein n=1 Tax=Sphingomonas sp. DT-207 TaxID=3396167 RepID=UPI003F1A4E9D